MAIPIDFDKYLGLFVADVPDTYLEKLPEILNARIERAKVLLADVEREKEYRKTFKKSVDENGKIIFGGAK